MGKILAITNQKGGVGKSTITFNMSTYLAEKYRKKVLVIDLDTQGNISHTLIKGTNEAGSIIDVMNYSGLQAKDLFDRTVDLNVLKPMKATHEIELVYTSPNDLTLAKSVYQEMEDGQVNVNEGIKTFVNNIQSLAENYDYVIMDCPPFIGEHVLAALLVCDEVISPVQPTSFVYDGTRAFFENLRLINRDKIFLGMVLNNVDKNWIRHQAMSNELKTALGEKVYNTVLYHRGPYDNAVYMNKPLYTQVAWRKAAEEFDNFLHETIEKINKAENCNLTLD